jgi:hypothetical protein
MLIIDKTIGPFVEERLATFRAEAGKLAEDGRSKEIRLALLGGYDPARAILGLKICDPAMGSGHFLVSLVDWLADKVLSAMEEAEQTVTWADSLYQSPLATEISKIRTDIIQHSIENKWPYVDEHLQDRHIVRRMVLKRCVYGVDKNPLAVELAILPSQPRLLAGILNQPIAWYYQFKKFPHKKDEALAMDIAALAVP